MSNRARNRLAAIAGARAAGQRQAPAAGVPVMRWGTVDVNNGDGTCDVTVEGGALLDVPHAASVFPEVGDLVQLLTVGGVFYIQTVTAPTPWTPYTPTWTASVTNPVLNNGTFTCAYSRVGNAVTMRMRLVMGSTTTYGSGVWRFTLPFTAVTDESNVPLGPVWVRDVATPTADSSVTGFALLGAAASYFEFRGMGGNGSSNQVTNLIPMTWANGDWLATTIVYEAA